MIERRTIGIDRELRLAWLDAAAARAAAGDSIQDARAHLNQLLQGVLGGTKHSGNRGKTVTVLLRIWVNVPDGCEHHRTRAVGLLGSVDTEERLALHWAMAMATYPFFRDTVHVIGRLLDLQGDAERGPVVKRMVENWGDRPTVSRACRAVWGSVVNWGVLVEAGKRGRYKRRTPLRVSPEVAGLLVGAAGTGVSSGSQNALFPFDVRREVPRTPVEHGVSVALRGPVSPSVSR